MQSVSHSLTCIVDYELMITLIFNERFTAKLLWETIIISTLIWWILLQTKHIYLNQTVEKGLYSVGQYTNYC